MATCWLARQPFLSELNGKANGATQDFGLVIHVGESAGIT